MSQFGTVLGHVNPFRKQLKTKAFISEKSLDTPVFRLLRFPQKVLTDSKPPLELFSLEEKAAQLPGGLFVLIIYAGNAECCGLRECARELLRNIFVSSVEFDFETMEIESA